MPSSNNTWLTVPDMNFHMTCSTDIDSRVTSKNMAFVNWMQLQHFPIDSDTFVYDKKTIVILWPYENIALFHAFPSTVQYLMVSQDSPFSSVSKMSSTNYWNVTCNWLVFTQIHAVIVFRNWYSPSGSTFYFPSSEICTGKFWIVGNFCMCNIVHVQWGSGITLDKKHTQKKGTCIFWYRVL